MNILLLFSREPSPSGHGGFHRAYQTLQDAQANWPEAHFIIVPRRQLEKIPSRPAGGYTWQEYRAEARDRLQLLSAFLRHQASPFRLFRYLWHFYAGRNTFFTFNRAAYEALLNRQKIDLCLLDHTMFLEAAQINQQRGIPTWVLPQNLETFDRYALTDYREKNLPSFLIGFRQELEIFRICQKRLLISRGEQWLLNGLNLEAEYYPYRPTGSLRERLLSLRARRAQSGIETGLFLMVGSSEHTTTGEGFTWLLRQAASQGWPDSSRLEVVGTKTETYAAAFGKDLPFTFHGWVSDSRLDDLLARAQAAIIPQRSGFGAVTRLAEFTCAGIPCLVSEHAAQAQELPPGVLPLPSRWQAWREALQAPSAAPSLPDWLTWEARQPRLPKGELA